MESMENSYPIENKEKLCPRCRKMLTDMVCYNVACDSFQYRFEETELETGENNEKEEKENGKKISDVEYARELKLRSQLPEELPTEAEGVEDLWSEEAKKVFAGAKKEKNPESEKNKDFIENLLMKIDDEIKFSRGWDKDKRAEYLGNTIDREIKEAALKGIIKREDQYNIGQEIWNILEKMTAGHEEEAVFIQMKSKRFIPIKDKEKK